MNAVSLLLLRLRIRAGLSALVVLCILASTRDCIGAERVFQSLNSPDGSKILEAAVTDVSNPENPTTVRLKHDHQTLWSTIFSARYVRFSWSPNSKYALIEVDHQKDILLSEKLYLLNPQNPSKLIDLGLKELTDKIGKAIQDDGQNTFGYRSGMLKPMWKESGLCEVVYILGAGSREAVIALVLDPKETPPRLQVKSTDIAKTKNESKDILNRLHAAGTDSDWD